MYPLKTSRDDLSHHFYSTSYWMHHTGYSLANTIKQEKEVKGLQIGEEERKWSPFTDDMIVYTENSKGIFHRTRTHNFKICMETQKTLNSQNNLQKEEKS